MPDYPFRADRDMEAEVNRQRAQAMSMVLYIDILKDKLRMAGIPVPPVPPNHQAPKFPYRTVSSPAIDAVAAVGKEYRDKLPSKAEQSGFDMAVHIITSRLMALGK